MPIHFYIAEAVDNSSERQALFSTARLLYQKFSNRREQLTFIANIPAQGNNLPQLDAVLMSEKFVALIDFKSVADPIINPGEENGQWYAINKHSGKKYPLWGGRSRNPRIQARNAHYKWSHYFRYQAKQFMHPKRYSSLDAYWNHLKGWILFSPQLHPETPEIPHYQHDHLWLHYGSVGDIVDLIFSNNSYLRLNASEQRHFVYHAFRAQPWENLQALLDQPPVGYLQIPSSTGKGITSHPLNRFERISIGRSSQCNIRVKKIYSSVSRHHATIEITREAVRLLDANSRNGTYVNNHRVSSSGTLLRDQDQIWLGTPKKQGSCGIIYQSAYTFNTTAHTAHTMSTD